MSGLGDWTRADGKPPDRTASDGYGTGVILHVLRRNGEVPADKPRLQKGVLWLKTHQRTDGSWFTPSPYTNDKLTTFAGTAYVILALGACGET